MNFKKIIAAAAAGAMALTMTAISAFATTVEIDAEYPGAWTSSGAGIKKADLEAVGGDVKVVLDVETYNPYGLADQFLVNVIDYDNGWKSQVLEYLTSDTIVAKTDGWICVQEDATSIEFVLDAAAIPNLGDDGITFSVQNVVVKSADYSLADSKEGDLTLVDDAAGKEYCFTSVNDNAASDDAAAEEDTAAEETADGETVINASDEDTAFAVDAADDAAVEETTTDAPAADDAAVTAPAATGNASVAVIVSVMAIAGAAAIASKRK